MFDDDDRARDWAGGGGWQDPDPPADDPPPPPKKTPVPAAKPKVTMKAYAPKSKRGLVAGRFLPLHIGHEHLLEVARRSSEDVDVVVFRSADDPISSSLRARWIQSAFPDVFVSEAAPSSSFSTAVQMALGDRQYDVFYGGEIAEGIAAAKSIGATFVPVDPDREAFEISGTQIREDTMKHFNGIASIARPAFVRRVAVVGPESTGKTELCKRLARIYSTRYVPEPARAIAEVRGGTIDAEAIGLWARTQIASEEAVARRADRVLFCDTHVRTAELWSERLFGNVPAGLADLSKHRDYDLVLLLRDDVPFVGRSERDDPEGRKRLFTTLFAVENPVVVIEGKSWESRTLAARNAVDQLLAKKAFLSRRGARMTEGLISG